jgi:MtfA peptidase
MFGWLKRRRRGRLLARPFPANWLSYLRKNVPQYSLLSKAEQARLRERVQIFIAEKLWVGCGGLKIDDEMRVIIAAQACLLLLGIECEYHYDRLQSVLVYPGTYLHPQGMHFDGDHAVRGEAWHRGPVVLSWNNTRVKYASGGNLVFHEFAHHLDDLDGEMDGAPPLEPGEERRWTVVVEREYRRLQRDSAARRVTLLDEYGASSRAEFFAVATERFFETPIALAQRHPALYEVLRDFYRQDPARWPWHKLNHAEAAVRETAPAKKPNADAHESASERADEQADDCWHPSCADGFFSRAVLFVNAGDYKRAEADLSRAIRLTPRDAELYLERAKVRLRLGNRDGALGDAEQAVRLDPEEDAAVRLLMDGDWLAGNVHQLRKRGSIAFSEKPI